MPDKKINIHIGSTADTKGVDDTSSSFDALDQDLDKIVENMERLGGEFEKAIGNGAADLAKDKFMQLRIESEKLKDTMVDLGIEGVEGIDKMTKQLADAEDQIESLAKEAKKGDDALEMLVDLEKINQLGEITNSVINVRVGFGTLTDMVRKSDGTLGGHIKTTQHMTQMGTEMGLSIIRATAAFGPWGGAVAAASLVVQAGVSVYQEYKRAQTAGADAAKKFADAAEEAAIGAKAQADSMAEVAKATDAYQKSVGKRAELEKAWGNQLARSNGLLDAQDQKINAQAEGAKRLLQAKAELAKATIDSDEKLSNEQKDKLKRGVDEQLTQVEFAIDQKRGRLNLENNEKKQANISRFIEEKIAQVNQLQRRSDGALGKEQKDALEAKKTSMEKEYEKAYWTDEKGAQKILDSSGYQDVKKSLDSDESLLGADFKTKEELDAKIKQYISEIEAKRAEKGGLKNSAELKGLNLDGSQSVENVRRKSAAVRERKARKRVRDKGGVVDEEAGLKESSERLAEQFAGAAKAGLKAGRKKDAELLKTFANELDDGASAQELKRAAETLAKMQSKISSDVLGVLSSAVQKLIAQERDLATLKQRINNGR